MIGRVVQRHLHRPRLHHSGEELRLGRGSVSRAESFLSIAPRDDQTRDDNGRTFRGDQATLILVHVSP